jgi:exosortase A-associated hydrolase 2
VTSGRVSGHFLDGAKGPIFVLRHGPPGARRSVLVVPPFAEEMNKCRRMITLVALRLSERGIATVIPDLYGTGDSGGEFVDADWDTWRDDVSRVARWTVENVGPLEGVLAIRLGAALAVAVAQDGGISGVRQTVLWQPVLDGKRFLNQFLRLRVAAAMASGTQESASELRRRLNSGEALEIAGYELSPPLAEALERVAPPAALPPGLGAMLWAEVSTGADPALPAPSQAAVDRYRAAGAMLETAVCAGEPYWSSTEIVVNAELVDVTASFIGADRRAAVGP